MRCLKGKPEFPVELGEASELHAAFREESRTSLPSASAALQEIREKTQRCLLKNASVLAMASLAAFSL